MYQTYRHHPRPRGSYFLPFFSIIILGLIVVLVFQIVDYFQEKRLQALENKAALSIVTGRADMKIFGVDEWTSAVSGSLLHEGDRLRTGPGSRIVLSLLNGTLVRVNSETEFEISALKSRDSQDEASFSLKVGSLWLKRSPQDTVRASLRVVTEHLEVDSMGTIFEVTAGGSESVRVLDGKVQVKVKVLDAENSRTRIADSLEVVFGQEVSLGPTDIANLQNRKPVNFLALLSDSFRDSEWYEWNRTEDTLGMPAVNAVADAVANQENPPLALPVPPAAEILTPAEEVSQVLSAPEIFSPGAEARTTKTGSVLISGTVSSATEKLEVTTYITGNPEKYTLQKYKAGDTKWTYLASREYGNLVAGENRFMFTAVGKDAVRSDAAEIVIFYDRPKEPADLSAPTVKEARIEITEDAVLAEGGIGKGIVKVVVNDFPLTRYVPDSLKWSYYARTVYGNLKEGENEYSVFGVDAEGNKTPVAKFVIVKKPKPEPAPVL